MKKNAVLWPVTELFFSPSPAGSPRGFFFSIYCGNLVRLLEVTNIVGLPWSFSHLEVSSLSLHQFINYSSGFLTLVPKVVSAHEFLLWWVLTPFICLSVSPVLEKAVVFVLSSLLWIQNTLLIFQSVKLFPVKNKCGLPRPFTWNWKLEVFWDMFYLPLLSGGVYVELSSILTYRFVRIQQGSDPCLESWGGYFNKCNF